VELAVTLNELANDPWFILFAPGGIVVVVVVLVLLGKGDIDI
jgi:hypothetical protein